MKTSMTTSEIIERVKEMCEAKGLGYNHIRVEHKHYTAIEPRLEIGVHYADTCFSSEACQTKTGFDITSLLEKISAQISQAANIHKPIQIEAQ